MSRLPSNIERSIKSKIEMTKCSVHGEHPKVTFTQQGFTVSCCCEKFRKDTITKCEKAVGDALQEEIFKSLKGLR
ncbi:hypothetical protein [Bacteroides sp.]|uniref:hypothetical protein n=1 Tax=Bacteroides sp. TaxID=29523 RepID=UPI003A8FDB7E